MGRFGAWWSQHSKAEKAVYSGAALTAIAAIVAAVVAGLIPVVFANNSPSAAGPDSTTLVPQASATSLSASSSFDSSPSPTPTPSNSPSPSDATYVDLKIEAVDIEVSDTYKVGAGLYQLNGRKTEG
jgi:hypothetical protein